MTTDAPEENVLGALRMEALPYVQMAIPGVPYSMIRVGVLDDPEEQRQLVWRAMDAAKLLRDAAAETFAEPFPELETVPREVPRQQQAARPAPARAVPVRRQAAAPTGLDPTLVVQGNCPEHGVPAKPSIVKYQEIEISDDGVERYAKYFCDSGAAPRHSLWARELV